MQPADDAQQEYEKLQSLSGAAFDQEFVSYMVMDHEKDIAAFRKEAQAKDGPASALAKKQLPVLEKHLRLARVRHRVQRPAHKVARGVGLYAKGR